MFLLLIMFRKNDHIFVCGIEYRFCAGVINELISKGKLISAVHFVHAFELVDRFPTVPLLMTYLKDLRRNSQAKRIKAPYSESVQVQL